MNPFEMVAVIVVAVMVASVLRAKYGHSRHRRGDIAPGIGMRLPTLLPIFGKFRAAARRVLSGSRAGLLAATWTVTRKRSHNHSTRASRCRRRSASGRSNRYDRTESPRFANPAGFSGCANSSRFRRLHLESTPSRFDRAIR